MKVSITATNVNQIVNADTIGINQLSALGPKERSDLIQQLLKALEKHVQTLSESPTEVSQADVRSLGAETKAILKDVGNGDSSHKFDVEKLFDKFRSCFGSATDVLLNAVKLAQLFGLGGS